MRTNMKQVHPTIHIYRDKSVQEAKEKPIPLESDAICRSSNLRILHMSLPEDPNREFGLVWFCSDAMLCAQSGDVMDPNFSNSFFKIMPADARNLKCRSERSYSGCFSEAHRHQTTVLVRIYHCVVAWSNFFISEVSQQAAHPVGSPACLPKVIKKIGPALHQVDPLIPVCGSITGSSDSVLVLVG